MTGILDFKRSELERRLSPEQFSLLKEVAGVAATRHLPLYLVGGFVRDLLLGLPATDFDLVVEGDAIPLARALAAQYGGLVTAHVRFGTAQWFRPGSGHHALDFISTRSEIYKHPAALPTVSPGVLIDDLRRRDFTINTLALRLDGKHWGELRDELRGLDDLNLGLVRVLHPGSFMDDPTRIFRAVRYEQRYGFQIVPETLSLIPPACDLISSLSAERLRHELDLILEEEKADSMLQRLSQLDLLQPVHLALTWNARLRRNFKKGSHPPQEGRIKSIPSSVGRSFLGWHFWLMELGRADLESLEQRLHFRATLFESLSAASALAAALPSMDGLKPSQWVARLEKLPASAVYAVFLCTTDWKARQDLYDYLENWRHVKPKTNGDALKKLGLPPGPRYQQVLQRLRDAWLDEEVQSEKEEMELLDRLTKRV
jgi:tRNA nucleotidyltransferase (CCA-adding enzyme)